MPIAPATANSYLDATFNATAYSLAVPWISLHDADPSTTGANEVTGGSYGRVDASALFGAASAGSVANSGDIDFTDMPAVTVTHTGVFDASTAGNFVWGGSLTGSKVLGAGDTFRFPTGNLTAAIS